MRKHLDALVPSLIGVALFALAVFWVLLPQTESLVMDGKQSMIRELTKVAWSLLDTYYRQEEQGMLTRKEAQHRAIERLRQFRFGNQGRYYFWILDKNVKGVLHPHHPQYEGRDMSGLVGVDDRKFLADAVRVAMRQGDAPVSYYWARYDDKKLTELKMSHVRYFEPWGWVIGTGIHVSDVKSGISEIEDNLLMVSMAILVVMVLIGGYVTLKQYQATQLQQQAEQAQAAANEKYLAVLTASPNPMIVYDRNGLTEYVNPAFTRVFGWTAGELLGHKVDYVPADCREETERAISQVFVEDAGGVVIETRRTTKDGRVLELSLSASSFKDQQGNIQGAVISLTDITHLKDVQSALRKSEESFRALSENSMDTIMRFDRQHRYLYVNRNVEKQCGIPQAEFIGRNSRELGFPDHLVHQWGSAIEYVFTQKQPQRIEFELPNGIWIDWQLIPEFNEQDEVEAVIASARDITASKQAEMERRAWDAKMRQSQKLEAIGTLAGGIAHDFNNILAAISGYAELASREGMDVEQCQRHMAKVLAASGRAKSLIKQILAFSQVSEDVAEPVRVDKVAREVLDLIRATLPANVEIVSRLETSGRVLADPTQIHQMLINLCANAGQAMEDTGGTVTLTVKESELDAARAQHYPDLKPGRYLHITVADTGPGIAPEAGERIFEPFFTTKEPDKGTGLGLAVVHGVVKKLGGAISFYSELGRGAVFHVMLPAMDPSMDDRHGQEPPPNPNGHERVLLVDDEQDIVDAGRQILEAFGYQVSATNSSLEALQMVTDNPWDFDVVVTDKTMPKLTGLELARAVKGIRPDLPVILSTGFGGADQEELAGAAGISRVLLKPFSSLEIGVAIRQTLDRPGPSAPPSRGRA